MGIDHKIPLWALLAQDRVECDYKITLWAIVGSILKTEKGSFFLGVNSGSMSRKQLNRYFDYTAIWRLVHLGFWSHVWHIYSIDGFIHCIKNEPDMYIKDAFVSFPPPRTKLKYLAKRKGNINYFDQPYRLFPLLFIPFQTSILGY